MRKEYFNYIIKLPQMVHELFMSKVSDYNFTDMTTVMNHLVKSYILLCDGKKISKTTRRILSHMNKISDMEFFFRRQDKTILFFEMDSGITNELKHAVSKSGLRSRSKLAIYLVCAFIASADVTLRKLSDELASDLAFKEPRTYLIHTYISNYQFVFFKETATSQHLTIEGMLTAAADMLLRIDNDSIGYYTPNALKQIAMRVLDIKGSTLKDFRRQKTVTIRTNSIGQDNISSFMRKYSITSPREFLRRVVLFFLEARYMIYKKEVELQGNELSDPEVNDWEDTLYNEYAKQDFSRSIYKA